jgi:hypothetical protein
MKHYRLSDYQTDQACLEMIFSSRFGRLYRCPQCYKRGHFRLINGRKRYDCQCGYEIHPLSGTIFQHSATPLHVWFYAIYLFATSHNGIAATELQKEIGVTYKTAWRISHQIRLLMHNQRGSRNQQVTPLEQYLFHLRQPKKTARLSHKRQLIKRISSFKKTQSEPTIEILHTRIQNFTNQRLALHPDSKFWQQVSLTIDEKYHVISSKYYALYLDEALFRYRTRHKRSRRFRLLLQASTYTLTFPTQITSSAT